MAREGAWRRRGSPATKRPAGKKGKDYVETDCPNCKGTNSRCTLCDGGGKIWTVP